MKDHQYYQNKSEENFLPGMLASIILMLIILGIIPMGLGSCTPKKNAAENSETLKTATEEPAASQTTVFAVNTTSAVRGQISDYIEVNGNVEASSTIEVYPDINGKLSNIYVSTGDRVAKDQILAQVDPSRPGQTFAKSPVKSTITGTITAAPIKIGATVSPAIPIFQVSRMSKLQISTAVSERFISKVAKGQTGLVELEAYPGEHFTARVSEIDPVVDPISRSLGLKLTFTANDPKIKAGMFAKIKLIIKEKEGIVKMPTECLVKRFGEYFVFVIGTNNVVEKRTVTPGIRIDNKVEIIKGLSDGEEIVIRGQTLLEDGAQVKIIEKIPGLPEQDSIL